MSRIKRIQWLTSFAKYFGRAWHQLTYWQTIYICICQHQIILRSDISLITVISIFCYSDLKRDKVKFCLFAPFSGGVRDICGSPVPIIHSTSLLAPPAGVYVGNRFIFMFMLTPSVFVSNRFIVYVDVQFTKSAYSYGFIMGSLSGKCNNQEMKQHAFNILSKYTSPNQFKPRYCLQWCFQT